jgi:hypothetical protein
VTCLQNCTDSACIDMCGTNNAAGLAANNALGTCISTNCATQCSGTGG